MNLSGERGSAPTEVALVAPVLIALMLFVVFVGRLTSTQLDVTAAARDGARAASLRSTPADGTADAERVVAESLDEHGVGCHELDVDVDTDNLVPGGFVIVTNTRARSGSGCSVNDGVGGSVYSTGWTCDAQSDQTPETCSRNWTWTTKAVPATPISAIGPWPTRPGASWR